MGNENTASPLTLTVAGPWFPRVTHAQTFVLRGKKNAHILTGSSVLRQSLLESFRESSWGKAAVQVRIWDYFNEKPFTLLESYMDRRKIFPVSSRGIEVQVDACKPLADMDQGRCHDCGQFPCKLMSCRPDARILRFCPANVMAYL